MSILTKVIKENWEPNNETNTLSSGENHEQQERKGETTKNGKESTRSDMHEKKESNKS
jgi:hypothetical protein